MSLYTFIPASPSKLAWDNRLFKEKVPLEQIPVLLNEKRPYFGGFVSMSWPPNRRLFPKGQYKVFGTGTVLNPYAQVQFSGPRELKEILEKLEWNHAALVSIWLSGPNGGYFGCDSLK